MRKLVLSLLLTVSFLLAAGCSANGSSDGGQNVETPDYLVGAPVLTKTISVGHISMGYPDALEAGLVDVSERDFDDGSTCVLTTGQCYNEDWSIIFTIQEYSGRDISLARAEVEEEMGWPERYDELSPENQAHVDRAKWLSLEDIDGGFVLTKTYDDTAMSIEQYREVPDGYARILASLPLAWYESAPGFFDAMLDSVVVNQEVTRPSGSEWYPTEIDPIYIDANGVTWGYSYHPEGEPDYVRVNPDMEYRQGDNGVMGYLNAAEFEAAFEAAAAQAPDEPGDYEVKVTCNLYAFLSDEVVGTLTWGRWVTNPAETPKESANAWIPVDDTVSKTADGRTWGFSTIDGSTDMEFVMATNTGRYGYISAEERQAAVLDNWNRSIKGEKNPTTMLNVVLYDSNEVVGQYAVTLYTE